MMEDFYSILFAKKQKYTYSTVRFQNEKNEQAKKQNKIYIFYGHLNTFGLEIFNFCGNSLFFSVVHRKWVEVALSKFYFQEDFMEMLLANLGRCCSTMIYF